MSCGLAPLLSAYGCPSSVCRLVHNLFDCGWCSAFRHDDTYPSLEVVIGDLVLLLKDPAIILFEQYDQLQQLQQKQPPGGRTLFFRHYKLYGRIVDATAITNSFCRVASTGHCEAFLDGGFSGSGKTRLVESVFGSVNVAGGCVVSKKFDKITTQSPSSLVISAFNELCSILSARCYGK